MKQIITVIIASLLFCSCTEQIPQTFTLTGKLPIDGYDGREVYLCRLDDELKNYINIDSSFIKGDTFSFNGLATDSLVARHIFIGKKGENRIKHADLIFIPEKGEIQMIIDKNYYPTISGTPLNDEYQNIHSIITPLKIEAADRVNAFLKAYMESDVMNPDLLADSKPSEEVNKAVFSYLTKIKQTPLFDDLYSGLARYINEEQKKTAESWLGPRYQNKINKYNQIIQSKYNNAQ